MNAQTCAGGTVWRLGCEHVQAATAETIGLGPSSGPRFDPRSHPFLIRGKMSKWTLRWDFSQQLFLTVQESTVRIKIQASYRRHRRRPQLSDRTHKTGKAAGLTLPARCCCTAVGRPRTAGRGGRCGRARLSSSALVLMSGGQSAALPSTWQHKHRNLTC